MLLFVLFSLLVSSVQEMAVALLKSRAASLWDGIEMLLGGGDEAKKARNDLYNHPLIRACVAPSSWKWTKPQSGKRTGPSYIASKTFSQALLDLLREPHKVLGELESELPRTLADLRSGDPAAASRAAAKVGSVLTQLPDNSPVSKELKPRLQALQQLLSAGAAPTADVPAVEAAIKEAIRELPDHWKAAMAEKAGTISDDLARTIRTLTANTAGGIDEFRKAIEDWFDQGMASVGGWYKRWTMAVQLGIGLVLAVALNIDTVHIVRELAVNESLRRSLAAQADAYARTGVLEQRIITADTSRSAVKASVRSAGVHDFTLVLPAEAAGRNVTLKATGASASAVQCDEKAAPDPAAKDPATAAALVACKVDPRDLTRRTRVSLEASYVAAEGQPATVAALDVFLLPGPEAQYEQIEKALQSTAVPIGWKNGALYPEQADSYVALVLAGVGWLFTAFAGSLGAPFWFDLLKRFSNLRATGPSPVDTAAAKTK
jgi:hypothetical protein